LYINETAFEYEQLFRHNISVVKLFFRQPAVGLRWASMLGIILDESK